MTHTERVARAERTFSLVRTALHDERHLTLLSEFEAALTAIDEERDALREALEPFANCVDQIAADEDDEEWAKFRLLIKDYRRAANALWPARKGFARCPICKGEFDEGEWNASSECPECETPIARSLSSVSREEN